MMSKKILAIDYGTVRLGLAISYDTLAEPLQVIPNDDQLYKNISEVIKSEQVAEIVVGISENKMAIQTHDFIDQLKQHFSLPIHTFDETLSSFEVAQKLKTAKKNKRGGEIDHFAAAVILQGYLDNHI